MRADRDFGFTDEQLMLRDAVRRFVRKEVPDAYARRCDHDKIAPLAERRRPFGNEVLRTVQGFDRSRLADRAWIGGALRLDHRHRLDEFDGTAGIADPPACHGV